MEESIKPITEEQEEFKPIEVQTPPTKIQPNQEIIKELAGNGSLQVLCFVGISACLQKNKAPRRMPYLKNYLTVLQIDKTV